MYVLVYTHNTRTCVLYIHTQYVVNYLGNLICRPKISKLLYFCDPLKSRGEFNLRTT